MRTDLMTVLVDLAPELLGLLGVEIQFLSQPPSDRIPVALPRGEVERVVLALAMRMRRCVASGSWILAGADRITMSEAEAVPLGLAAGEYGMLRFAAGLEAPARGSPRLSLASVAADSMTAGVGGETLRTLAAQRAGIIRIESVPGAGVTATVYLRTAGVGGQAPTLSGERFG
jgi:hypothetical protein